jgi:hypothetical protein
MWFCLQTSLAAPVRLGAPSTSALRTNFTILADEDGYCKLYGLRFELDQMANISGLLGHPLDIRVTVTDTDEAGGVGKRSAVLLQPIHAGA